MILEFIKISFQDDNIIDDLASVEELEAYLSTKVSNSEIKRKAMTLRASEVTAFEPNDVNEKWTDVYLMDGDIIIADLPYLDFKMRFHTAINFNPKGTWDIKHSGDPRNLEIVVFKN